MKPQVVKVEKIESHPNDERLIIASFLGDFSVVTDMANLNVNDLVGYIPPNTVVPDNKDFYFLCPRFFEKVEKEGDVKMEPRSPKYSVGEVPEKFRTIKRKKIRGVYSDGILHPLPPYKLIEPGRAEVYIFKEGHSVVDVFDLKVKEE